jgi:hypothetical protein
MLLNFLIIVVNHDDHDKKSIGTERDQMITKIKKEFFVTTLG